MFNSMDRQVFSGALERNQPALWTDAATGWARKRDLHGEPHAARMGELLQGRHRQHGLSSARQLHGSAVASVVALQAQNQAAAQGQELSTLAPVRALRARTLEP